MKQTAKKVRPLIVSKPVDEFGEVTDELSDMDETGMLRDLTYVPGWTELRYERDAALAEVAQGRRAASDVPALPVRVRMVRRAGVSGAANGQKLMAAFNDGYKPITTEHLGQEWFTALPPGARVMENGDILNAAGDCQYMYVEGPRAATNAKRARERMLSFAEGAGLNPRDSEGRSEPGITQSGGTFGKVTPK